MSQLEIGSQQSRHRHRSQRRKLAETILLLSGVPILLFLVLALSVGIVEYHPSGHPPSESARQIAAMKKIEVPPAPAPLLAELPPRASESRRDDMESESWSPGTDAVRP